MKNSIIAFVISILVLFSYLVGTHNPQQPPAEDVFVEETASIYRTPPNRDYEESLPNELLGNYRVTNIVPGYDVWVVEELPEKFYLIVYLDGKWTVTERTYEEALQPFDDFQKMPDMDNTAGL